MRKRDDIDRLHDEIRELVDDLWHVPRFVAARHGFRPNVDCLRSDDPPALHVIVELPGVDPALLALIRVDHEGLLEPFVLLNRADPQIAQDYPAYRAAHRDKLYRYMDEFVLPKSSTQPGK